MYTLFSQKTESTHALVFLFKTLQANSSKITLKLLSQSWLIRKRLCLRPSTETIFSSKKDEPILMLLIPIIFPLELSPKVTVPPSWYLDRVAKLLISCHVPWVTTIKIPSLPTSWNFSVYLHQLIEELTLVPKFSWILEC